MDYITEGLPGTGGVFKATPEDFLVEEVPAYLPGGSGEHTFLWIEKRGLNTKEALSLLCRALGAREGDAGVAGQKDRQAVTRQWVSLQRVEPQAALGLTLHGRGPAGGVDGRNDGQPDAQPGSVTVLRAERHGNKLRTGHLKGNRFTLVLRDTEDGLARARAIFAGLLASGLPNRYGAQRFGFGGRNQEDGRRLVRGELRVSDRFRRKFLVSAYQAALFNRYLERRQREGLLARVLVGDLLQKHDSGGLFCVSESEVEDAQRRVSEGAVAVTGPMFGSRMRAPAPGSLPAGREADVLAEEKLTAESFAALGSLAEGTRRALLVPLGMIDSGESVESHPEDPRAVVLRFALPPGSYATVLLEEIMKPAAPLPLSI